MSLKARIEKAMALKQCDVAALANASGVKAPSAHGWLNGSSKSMRAGPAIKAAAYLGVNPLWLAEGEGEMISYEPSATKTPSHTINEPAKHHKRKLVQRVCDVAENIDDTGLRTLIDMAECIARNHPIAKAKLA